MTPDPIDASTVVARHRADIPARYRWDFSAIYPDWPAWEADLGRVQRQMDDFAALQGTLAGGPQALLAAYRAQDEIGKRQYRLYRYPQLQRDVDTRDQAVAGRFQRVLALFSRFDAATAWLTPELLAIPESTVRGWLDSTPELAPWRHPILDAFRRRAHVLDESGERLLSLAGPVNASPSRAYEELSTSDIRFPVLSCSDGRDVRLTPAAYQLLLQSHPVQADRARAAEAHLGTYAAHEATYAALYKGVLERDWFVAQARRFDSTLEAALHDHAIPVAVVENLIAATRAGTAPLRRYLRLRRRLLGVAELHPYDQMQPLVRSRRRWPYDEALRLVRASVTPLGAAYGERFDRFVGGSRIDVYESEGKVPGAYNAGVYGVGPYLLLNHNDTLDSLFTLAHEAGHALHTVLSHETQPFATADCTIFVAEVASITHERLLLHHLLQAEPDGAERFGLLQRAVDQIMGTFYAQVLFADFELQAHRWVEQGEPVTAERLGQLYLQLVADYQGDEVVADAFYRHTWARIGHFYRSPYYVYQYATCLASSAMLFRAMTEGDAASCEAATRRYLELLRAGGNDHPMEQLRRAGVDLAQPQPVQAVIAQMDELVAAMELEAEAMVR